MNLTDEQRGILLKAADEIERRGICYGTASDYVDAPYDNHNCKVCILGALSLAAYGTPREWDSYDPDYLALVSQLAEKLGYARVYSGSIPPTDLLELVWMWNDATDENGEYYRTADEAAELLRRAAA